MRITTETFVPPKPKAFTIAVGTSNPTNLLTQSAVAAGQTLVVQIGANTTTITFGTGGSQVSTLAEIQTIAEENILQHGPVGEAASFPPPPREANSFVYN